MQHSGKNTFPIIITLILILFSSAHSQKRPTVGVALSGGSAKGIAHIGVLKVLEEINMPIDYVTGTSMGSIVGGLYSVGYTAAELDSIVTEIDWPAIFAEETSRDVLTLEQKKRDARYTFNLALENWGISIPAGIVAGHKVTQLLTRLTLPVQHLDSFSQYPIPFACVATDIATGEAVVIKDGSLAEAMRASMAIPSAFTPVERDGKLLVDGLLVRNFPVQDARALGADIVIGVDVGAELYEAEELNNLFTMLDQVLNLQMIGSTELERDMTDFLLIPELGDLGFADFTKTAEFIAKGEEVARSILPELKALADSLNNLEPWTRNPRPATPQMFKISEIAFEGLTSVSEKLMIAQFPYILPATLAVEDIEQFVDQVYRNQVFERVNYRLVNAEGGEGARLIIHAIERSQSLLQLGARYNSRDDAALLVNTTFFNLFKDASTLTMDLRLGSNLQFDGQYFMKFGLVPAMGLNARLNYTQDYLDIFEGDNRLARFDLTYSFFDLFLGSNFSSNLLMGGGVRAEYVESDRNIGPRTLPDRIDRAIVPYVTLGIDTWNHSLFPTSGLYAQILSEFTNENINSDGSFSRHLVDAQAAIPLPSNFTLLPSVYFGTTFGDSLPPHYRFTLGGAGTPMTRLGRELNFMGLRAQSKTGQSVQMAQLGLQWEFMSRRYAQVVVNLGRTLEEWQFSSDPDDYSKGAGLILGIDTPIGPAEFIAHANDDDFFTYLNIGYKF